MEDENNNENSATPANVANSAIFDKEYANAQNQDAPHLMMLKDFEEHLTAEDTAKIKRALEESVNGEITVEDNDGCVFKIKDNKVREITASENSESAKGKFHFFQKDDKIKLNYSYREKNDHGFQKKSIKYKENEDSSKYKYKEVEQTKSSGLVERKTASTKIKTDEDSKVVTQKRTQAATNADANPVMFMFNGHYVEQNTDTKKYKKNENEWEEFNHTRSKKAAYIGILGISGSYEKTTIHNEKTTDENGNLIEVTKERTNGIGLGISPTPVSVKSGSKTTYSANGEKIAEKYSNTSVSVGLGASTNIVTGEIDHTTNSSYRKEITAGLEVLKGAPLPGAHVTTEVKTPDLQRKSDKGLGVVNTTFYATNKTISTKTTADEAGNKKTVTTKKGGGLTLDPVDILTNAIVDVGTGKDKSDLKATMKAQAQKDNTDGTPQSNTEENASTVKPNLKETMKNQAQERSQEANASKNSAQNTVTENATAPQPRQTTEEKNTVNANTASTQNKQTGNQAMLYAKMQKLRGR